MSALLRALPPLATTGVGSLPFTDPGQAAAQAARAYDVPFCPQLYWVDGDMVTEWLGAGPARCGWSPDRDRECPTAWEAFVDRLEREPPVHGIAKLQVTGPLTLAVALEQRAGRPGTGADVVALAKQIADWLAANMAGQVWRLRDHGITALVVVDEPGLAAAGLGDDDLTVWDPLRPVAPAWGLHVCGRVPWELVYQLDLDLLSFDAVTHLDGAAIGVLRAMMVRGCRIAWGVLDAAGRVDVAEAAQLATRAIGALVRPGLRLERALALSLLTPTCGTGRMAPAGERLAAACLTATAQRTAATFAAMTRGRMELRAD